MSEQELPLELESPRPSGGRWLKLSTREIEFLQAYLRTKEKGTAYAEISPRVSTAASAQAGGSRMMRRIKEKFAASGGDWLDEFNLGVERLLAEMNDRLQSTTTVFHKDHAIAEVQDNSTRMAATRLLAELHRRSLGVGDVSEIHQHAHVHLHRASDAVEERLAAVIARLSG